MTVARLAVSMPPDLVERLKADADSHGESVSSWLAEAAEARLRQANLARYLDEYEAEFGKFTDEEMAKVRSIWPD